MFNNNKKGFTLIELLVVIAIIGILSAIVLTSLNSSRQAARDSQRLNNIREIRQALELYALDNDGAYPSQASGDGGYEYSYEDNGAFIQPLVDQGYLPQPIVDPINDTNNFYAYFSYSPANSVSLDCSFQTEGFYILRIKNFETIESGTHPESPGFACVNRDWETTDGGSQWAEGRSWTTGAQNGL